MSDLPKLLEGNRRFSAHFADGELPIRPRLSTIVLTCLDARVDPAHLFDLQLGDALVIRNAGGRLNRGVLTDLAVLGQLSAALSSGKAMTLELVILHHTDCGMSRFADLSAREALAQRLGIEPDEVATTMAITDPSQSVQDDITRLRQAPGLPDTLVVSGLIYDVADGIVEQIVAPAPLRTV
jgi:carbonic anhydrase